MRLLLVSDLHYTLPQLDWLVRAAPRYDLVVIAGDSLDIASAVSLDVQSVVLLRYLALLGEATRVVVSSGNHDLTGPDAQGEQSAPWLQSARGLRVATDHDAIEIGELRVLVCPWWDGPLGRAALEARFEREAARLAGDDGAPPRKLMWVYHWAPLGSPTCWTGRRHYGDADLAAWIDRFGPDLVLTGHVHEPPFKPEGGWADRRGRSWVFNAGRQIGPVPAHVEIDLAAGSACWRSMMGEETLELSAAAAPPRSVF